MARPDPDAPAAQMPSKKLRARARARRTAPAALAPAPASGIDCALAREPVAVAGIERAGAAGAPRAVRRDDAKLHVPVRPQVASAGGGLSAPQIAQRIARARIRARLITKLAEQSGRLVTDLFDIEGCDDDARAELCAIALAQLDDQADQARRALDASGAE